MVPDLEGSVRDFMAEEEEQAQNEEDEMIEAKVSWAAADPAPEYLPLYQDPPGVTNTNSYFKDNSSMPRHL